jgi:hypothetical protein
MREMLSRSLVKDVLESEPAVFNVIMIQQSSQEMKVCSGRRGLWSRELLKGAGCCGLVEEGVHESLCYAMSVKSRTCGRGAVERAGTITERRATGS